LRSNIPRKYPILAVCGVGLIIIGFVSFGIGWAQYINQAVKSPNTYIMYGAPYLLYMDIAFPLAIGGGILALVGLIGIIERLFGNREGN
jgi:hypothetical protein